MADPLSITASIIAVLGALDSVGKAIAKVRTLKNSSDDLIALINEVSDYKVVLHDIERHFRNPPQSSDTAAIDQHTHLASLIKRAKDPLLELEQMIEHRFQKTEARDGQVKVSRVEWLRAKSAVERLRQKLRDTRQNIQSYTSLINSYVATHLDHSSILLLDLHRNSSVATLANSELQLILFTNSTQCRPVASGVSSNPQ